MGIMTGRAVTVFYRTVDKLTALNFLRDGGMAHRTENTLVPIYAIAVRICFCFMTGITFPLRDRGVRIIYFIQELPVTLPADTAFFPLPMGCIFIRRRKRKGDPGGTEINYKNT